MPPNATQTLRPLKFQIAGETFTMDATAQLIPMDQNTAWGGDPGKQYGVVTQLGKDSGRGLDFVFGVKYLERFYAVSRGSTFEKHKLIEHLAGIRHRQKPDWICSDVSLGRCHTFD